MKNSAHGELVEPCVLRVSVVKSFLILSSSPFRTIQNFGDLILAE